MQLQSMKNEEKLIDNGSFFDFGGNIACRVF